MRAMLVRAEQFARAQRRRRIDEIVQELRSAAGGWQISADAESVYLTGRGMLRRWLLDPALRFVWGRR